MKFDGVTALDLQDIGDWPLIARLMTIAVIAVGTLLLGLLLVIDPLFDDLDSAKRQEDELKDNLALLQRTLVDQGAFERYLQETEARFGFLLYQLPGEAEVEALVEDISKTGVANDLVFHSFQPGEPIIKQFYAERPIALAMEGSYHQLGRFVSDLASLPRMVTLHDIRLTPKGAGATLAMEATAKIYWYLDTVEAAQAAAPR